MESPSALVLRGLVPWQGLLLAASLLTFWSPPAAAQLTVVPINAPEGKDVILPILNMPPNVLGIEWYKGLQEDYNLRIALMTVFHKRYTPGPAYSGREKIIYDGSLLLEKVTKEDTGYYTIIVYSITLQRHIASARLHVYEPVIKPVIQASKTTVVEHSDGVVLTCYSNSDFTLWFFNRRRLKLNNRMLLFLSNRTLTIDPVRREDAGYYQCLALGPYGFQRSELLKLDVKYE